MSKLLDLWSDMTGVVLDYALATPPSSKWMMCYGQALPSGDATTARLRAKLLADGSPYGTDGGGNPLLPDARGRAIAGKDDMGGASASRLTTAVSGINGLALGAAGGSQSHTLTSAQMPTHNHGVNDPGHGHSASQDAHSHTLDGLAYGRSASGYGLAAPGSGYTERVPLYPNSSSTNTGYTSAASAAGVYVGAAATGISTQNNGSGGAHPNAQPTLVLNKIIRL